MPCIDHGIHSQLKPMGDRRAHWGFGIEPGSTAIAVVAERRSIGRHMKEVFHACNLN